MVKQPFYYLFAALFVLTTGAEISRVGAAEPSSKIIVVGSDPDHAYGSHMYRFDCELLATCLRKNGVAASTLAKWPPTDEELQGVTTIVFYTKPMGSVVLAPQHRTQFLQQMASGVGLVAIHWGTGVGYDALADDPSVRDEYRSLLGGWFRRPPCDILMGQAPLSQVDPQHPIARGWRGWEIRDEFYLRPVLDARSQPLLSVDIEGEKNIVGWTIEREGGGRSVGITLGHYHENFARDDFRRLIVNSILWAARQDVPASGSIVAVEPEDLQLPPEVKTPQLDSGNGRPATPDAKASAPDGNP